MWGSVSCQRTLRHLDRRSWRLNPSVCWTTHSTYWATATPTWLAVMWDHLAELRSKLQRGLLDMLFLLVHLITKYITQIVILVNGTACWWRQCRRNVSWWQMMVQLVYIQSKRCKFMDWTGVAKPEKLLEVKATFRNSDCWSWWVYANLFLYLCCHSLPLPVSPFFCTPCPLSSIVQILPYAQLCQSRWQTAGGHTPPFASILRTQVHVATGLAKRGKQEGDRISIVVMTRCFDWLTF